MSKPSGRSRAGSDIQVIESCNSTWLFDSGRLRYRRVPKGTAIDVPVAAADWDPYYGLELDAETGAFVVTLNESGTRMLRSYQHGSPCPHCDTNATSELSLEAVKRANDL